MAFGEDDSRIRTGHTDHNMTILKRIAHNLLRQDRSLNVGIVNKQLAADWNKDYLCRLIGLKPKPVSLQSPCRMEYLNSYATRTVLELTKYFPESLPHEVTGS